jgi:hypothetical protein
LPPEYDAVSVEQLELGVELRPARAWAFFAGWRWLSYEGENENRHGHRRSRGNSELELTLDGPVAGLSLSF